MIMKQIIINDKIYDINEKLRAENLSIEDFEKISENLLKTN